MRWTGVLLAAAAATACSKKSDERGKSPTPAAVEPARAAAAAPAPAGYDEGALGALRFDVTGGTAIARQHFQRGLLALHSFWYDEARKQFEAAIAADSSFRMAYWGLAMSRVKLLWGDDDLKAARAALRRMPDPDGLSPREQAWVVAAVDLLGQGGVAQSRNDFVTRMEQLHASFPDDESATFLAVGLIATLTPDDPGALDKRKRAAALAQEVFERNPKHPGAAHYVIHAYDTPELAELALPAARAYAAIAPEAFHARHMPAHIFARLGMWKEAAASCQSAWDASVAYATREGLSVDHHDFHSLNWLVEIGFERGRRADADAALKLFGDRVRGGLNHQLRALYAAQVTSAMARTGEWTRVDELLAPLEAPASDAALAAPAPAVSSTGPGETAGACAGHPPAAPGAPFALLEESAVLGARGRSAAMRGDVGATSRALAERQEVDKRLAPILAATQSAEALARTEEGRAQLRAVLTARARKDDRALLKALRPMVAAEEAQFAAEGAAGGVLVREEIGETLLRLGRAREALVELEAVLARHRGRARSLLGAARAAHRSGQAARARDHYQKLLDVWSEADADTDGLAEARQAVAAPP